MKSYTFLGDVRIDGSGDLLRLANTSGAAYATVGIADGNGRLSIYENADSDGDKYINSEEANRMTMTVDGINFYTAPSGTAGGNVTWTEIVSMNTSGNVGIGDATPSEKLDVNGKTRTSALQVTTGAAANKVLTSDGSGNATWQDAPTSPWTLDNDSVSLTGKRVGIGIDGPTF